MRRLAHSNDRIEASPQHGVVWHLQPNPIHGECLFWTDLAYNRLCSTALQYAVRIYSPGNELEIGIAAAPYLSYIVRRRPERRESYRIAKVRLEEPIGTFTGVLA